MTGEAFLNGWWLWLASGLTGISVASLVLALASAGAVPGTARRGFALGGTVSSLIRRILPKGAEGELRDRLRAAGFFLEEAPALYRLCQLALACATALAAAGWAGWCGLGLTAFLAALGAGAAFGAGILRIALSFRLRRRWSAIDRVLPYGIEFVALSLSAGQTVEASMFRAARELRSFAPDLAEELFQAAVSLHTPAPYLAKMQNLPSREWRAFLSLLHQGERHGLSLLPSLHALARSIAAAQTARCEEAAARLGPRLTIPLILFFLPPIFILVLTPAMLSVLQR